MSKKKFAAWLPIVVGLTALTAGATIFPRPVAAQNVGGGKIQSNVVLWKDPKEDAFSVEIPEDWGVNGGLNRNGASRFNQSVQVFRADGDLLVQIGDAGLPPFVPLDANMIKAGVKEGETVSTPDGTTELVMHPLTADEFNTWWAKTHLTKIMDDLKVGIFHNEKELTPKYTAIQQKDVPLKLTLSIAETAFTGKLKENGREVRFVILSVVVRTDAPNGGGYWVGHPIILGWGRGEQEAANVRADLIALTSMMTSWRDNPEWIHDYDAKMGPSSSLKNGASLGQRLGVMGTYWKNREARFEVVNDIARFIEHIPGGTGGDAAAPPPTSKNPFSGL